MSDPAVAITGMGCLFPGAPDVATYWSNILGGVDSTSEPPPEAWDPDVYYDPEFADSDKTYCQRGGYLGSLATFDPLAFGIAPVSVGGEPDQWLALRVAHAALVDAGATELAPEIRARTSIILGKGTYLNGGNAIAVQRGLVVGQTIDLLRRLHPEHSEDYLSRLREMLLAQLPALGPDTVPGLIPNIIVGRIANRFDLMGPAYTVDAACASSLVAIEHAVRALQAGESDLALAGGAQVWMPVATMNLFCRLGALSRRQQLSAFDANADGTLLGEGIGMIVMRRLEDAVGAGDRIYAVIRGVGVASDGRGAGVMAPRVEGEELALRRAYQRAGVSPASVGLIEAHGTGTPVGDVAEVQALTRVFGERGDAQMPRVALGTVKSMISHTIPAAGVAGVIKTALALHHRVLPPTLHVEQPNPRLELERTPFYLNTRTRPWIHGGAQPRRAGVNAFGFGGINAHAVLEEYGGSVLSHEPARDSELCLLGAASAAELADLAQELCGALTGTPAFTLCELAASLARDAGAVAGAQRLAVVAESLDDLRLKLSAAAEKLRDPACRRIRTAKGVYYEAEPFGAAAKVVLVFPGEGSQYPNMLADLCLHFPEARETFDRIDRLYTDHPRGHLLSDWVYPPPAFSEEERRRTEARLMDLDIAVESVLTANAAVHAVLRRLVPRIDAMVGHSTGEHSAAIAAGTLDLVADGDLATFCHGLHASYAGAAERDDVPAAMLLALGVGAQEAGALAAESGGELYVAMDNCPHQVVLVGDAESAGRAREIALGRGIMCEVLPYDRAVHTPRFAPFAADLRDIFARVPVRAPATPLWSCTTTAPYPTEPASIRELLVEHWTSPVRFRETIQALYADGARVFLESGPRGNMTSFIEDILRGQPVCAVAADVRRRSGVSQLNHLAAMLAAQHVAIDAGYLFESRQVASIDWRAPAVPAPGTDGPRIPLSTSWPMLRLSPEAVASLPAQPAPASSVRAAPPPAPAATPAAAASAATRAASAATRAASAATRAASAATRAASAATRAAPAATRAAPAATPLAAIAPDGFAGADLRAAMLEGHLALMEQFLQTGADVMRGYVAGRQEAPPPVHPLLGTVVSFSPGQELTARRAIDLDEDLYLRDHTLGRAVSRQDPELTALALMPLAMSLEILAQAAAALLPGRAVTGLRQVRGHRWLIVAEAPVTVEVSARLDAVTGSTRTVAVTLGEVGGDGHVAAVAEALVVLADTRSEPPAPTIGAIAQDRPARWRNGDELYAEAMFHGPLWQGVTSIDAVSPEGALAQLRVPRRLGMLRRDGAPSFVLDPVLLDAAGQVVGFWAADRLERGRVVFPFRLAALDVYGDPPVEGESFACAAAITLDGEQLTSSDIEVVDASGRCRMRLGGWEDKRFDVPARFRPLTSPGRLDALSSAWDAPLTSHTDRPIACRRMNVELGADAVLWRHVWAARILSRAERRQFAALRFPQRRRDEWLAGRTAAKEAVAELVRLTVGADLLHADIEIVPDERGRPTVVTVPLGDLRPIVSITHSGGEAAALAALVPLEDRGGVGIDLELLTLRPPGFAEAALADQERALIDSLPDGLAEEWCVRCWCAKESVAKAAGAGLVSGVEAPVVVAVDVASQAVQVEIGGRQAVVHTQRDGDLIVATTCGTPVWSAV